VKITGSFHKILKYSICHLFTPAQYTSLFVAAAHLQV